MQKGICQNDAKSKAFPIEVYTWNGLKEMIMAKNVQLKEKLDKNRKGDRTTCVTQALYTTTR